MKIPTELLNKWKAIRSHGDNTRISEQFHGVLAINVSRAFDGRDIKDEVFIAIRDFYAAKEARLYPPAVPTEKTKSDE